MRATRTRARVTPWLSLATTALAWGLSAASPSLQSACALTPDAISGLQIWRLWTGHLVHFGVAQLRGDLLAFFVWAALVEAESRVLLGRVLLGAAPLLALGILVACPGLAQYRGLSGLDCSLVMVLLVRRALPSARLRPVGWLCFAGFGAKCGFELFTGRAVLAPDLGRGVALLPLSHLLGAALGLLVVWGARYNPFSASSVVAARTRSLFRHCRNLRTQAQSGARPEPTAPTVFASSVTAVDGR